MHVISNKKGSNQFAYAIAILVVFFIAACNTEDQIDFNTQIRPILNDHCLVCHGGVKQQGDLSFLFEEEAFLPARSGKPAIVPGHPERSELIKRINHANPEYRMPLDQDPLHANEIVLLKKWISQGARWQDHWAYQVPLSPSIQEDLDDWCHNRIDQFVKDKMEDVQLSPAAQADRQTLIRRLSLDLTGLPPTLEETSAFVQNTAADAYEQEVLRLLVSPHFGEKWASMWLDLARYADSRGYQKDLLRPEMWRYRDWVIHAFNEDIPFDEFTVAQLAGDLLPDHSENHLLATAFHRNTMTNDEGGTDDEEFRVAAVIDRLSTTMEIWQGTTIGCVQCHSHPYDPIKHEEFYELLAFFNNSADSDDYADNPTASLLSPAQMKFRTGLKTSMQKLEIQGDTLGQEYKDQLSQYISSIPGHVPIMRELPLEESRKTYIFDRGNWLVHGEEVSPDVPGAFPAFQQTYTKNRLGLANWIVSPDNPLTARVTVNRIWEQLFGTGIVETLEDFGTVGALPTHPELLDWLALSFINDHQWHLKSLIKEIVMSSTYRQSSEVSHTQIEIDPNNKYLSRYPRYRLSAEQIRDQALVISGLINRKVYGASVMPHQPEGVWNVIRHAAKWKTSTDGDQYRRGLYTFWRRVSPYPSMMSFDTPSRELCVSRRIRTNTPLQALITLNDPVFVDAAEHLAERMTTEGGSNIRERIGYGFQLALMRPIDDERLQLMTDFYESAQKEYSKSIKDEKEKDKLSLVQVASVILNLDEVIMKS